MKKVNFYFDFLSPFSFFAWTNHQKELQKHDLTFVYKPVLMGKLFSHHEFTGPGMIPAKRNYELKKCFRYAHNNNISFHPPSNFPFNPLAIIRLATLTASGDEQFKVIDLIFKSVWQKGLVLEDPELVENILKEGGFSKDLIERSFSRDAKLELKKNIKEAIQSNIFGVPTFEIDDEYFWGNDSFNDLNNYILGNDNWNKNLYNELLKKN
jgi:2-hydroxychromene-2-carboxylate isomerase